MQAGMSACRSRQRPNHSWCRRASILLQAHDSAAKQEEETAWEAERHESKYARTLEQLPATKKVRAPHAGRLADCTDARRTPCDCVLASATVPRWQSEVKADGRHTRLTDTAWLAHVVLDGGHMPALQRWTMNTFEST